ARHSPQTAVSRKRLAEQGNPKSLGLPLLAFWRFGGQSLRHARSLTLPRTNPLPNVFSFSSAPPKAVGRCDVLIDHQQNPRADSRGYASFGESSDGGSSGGGLRPKK